MSESSTIATSNAEREDLEAKYRDRIVPNPDLDRALVSFQANKKEPFYRWLKYKEGFSRKLVEYVLRDLFDEPGKLLDPFAGSAAALFAARDLGWECAGIELLPVGIFATEARLIAESVRPEEFGEIIERIAHADLGKYPLTDGSFPHLNITRGAFSERTERQLNGYLSFCRKEIRDPNLRKLLMFAAFCVLEAASFTRKDGQYLRWDHRANRLGVKTQFEKGVIPSFVEALCGQLDIMLSDMANGRPVQKQLWDSSRTSVGPPIEILEGSCLYLLREFRSRSYDAIVTSPPYCNRYDYTRTYALELAFVGKTEDEVKELRQALLSCTVENREKVDSLRCFYAHSRRKALFEAAEEAFHGQRALHEIIGALDSLRVERKLNNPNIVRMIRNYFFEMAIVIFEMARLLKKHGHVVMVNDNVRYAGENVPVDLILSDFAEAAGLDVRSIWTLNSGKGNSSQQMGAHGRTELRKCVYVWSKP